VSAERWRRLLSTERLASSGRPAAEPRSPFERDIDRIIFSPAFRRLADRTQVLPDPQDDHVHSRLTHSLEVSTLGRSLGTRAAQGLADSGALPAGLDPRDVGDCVAAASLIHDLGNPPFGHAGEQAVREFFAGVAKAPWMRELTPRQAGDFLQFEGNAQSLRLALRTARPSGPAGLNLCFATLGALVKYPCGSTLADRNSARASTKKCGVLESEEEPFARVATVMGLAAREPGPAWQRHPLVFLTEAADDITYALVDLEDALRLGHVTAAEFGALLRPFAGRHAEAAEALTGSKLDRDAVFEKAGLLRSDAMTVLIDAAVEIFRRHLDGILTGEFDRTLMGEIAPRREFEALTRTARERFYRSSEVLRMEITGAAAIQGVLAAFTAAAFGEQSIRAGNLRRLAPQVLADQGSTYERLLRITDYVSGMTDGYVLKQYRIISGEQSAIG